MATANMKAHKLGWIGIGRMGYAMAERLAKAGCDITVWNPRWFVPVLTSPFPRVPFAIHWPSRVNSLPHG